MPNPTLKPTLPRANRVAARLSLFVMHKHTLSDLLFRYERWVLKPIQADIRRHRTRNQFVSFILFSVIIDNLASIRYLGEMPKGVGKRYKRFIREYMPTEYSVYAEALYKNFRCKIVHEFQIKGFDLQQSARSRAYHLSNTEEHGNIILNAQRFLKDLLDAFKKMKRDMVGEKAKMDIVTSFKKSGYEDWLHVEYPYA